VLCQQAASSFFLTHVKNRGGLLLSPHNVHKNAAGIKAAGADMDQLGNAWCTELPDAGPARKLALEKNASLIKRADGLLAMFSFCEICIGLRAYCCILQACRGRRENEPEIIAAARQRAHRSPEVVYQQELRKDDKGRLGMECCIFLCR